MIVILKEQATQEKTDHLIAWLERQNLKVHTYVGQYTTVLITIVSLGDSQAQGRSFRTGNTGVCPAAGRVYDGSGPRSPGSGGFYGGDGGHASAHVSDCGSCGGSDHPSGDLSVPDG